MQLTIGLALAAPLAAGGDGGPAPDFVREVQPVLSRNCFPCHGPDPEHREEGLRLDLREDALRDRGGYRTIVPGDADASELWLRVADELDPMPPASSGRVLSADEKELLRRWIETGADYAPHWAFVPPARSAEPVVEDERWSRNPIDRFVLARLEVEGLAPSPEADRATLLRRVSLDLTGLPPTLAELDAFLADDETGAYERVVNRLLASPAYGERQARIWLDLARYADSAGHGSDPLRTIWRYRDWVIDAFNANMPFDRFTVEQLAGDLLPDATVEQRLATAFHRNTMTNTEGGTDDEEFRVAAVKDRAITTAQVWTGLTAGCAQCHSHKYDPISQREFYSLYAFFDQTADTDKNDDRPRLETPTPAQAAELAGLRGHIGALQSLLDDPARDVSAGLARWEAEERERESSWVVIDPESLESAGGATLTTLTALDDGSILASGTSPEADSYTITATTPLDDITAVRLEVLPDERLAAGGPGRLPGTGNVVLNEVRVTSSAGASTGVAGRFVRVTNLGDAVILSLAEVEAWSAGMNVARAGSARQSSTGYGGVAARAIDGNSSGHYSRDESVTHTATERDPWWELDLGSELPLARLRLWNRTDGGLQHRLADFTVEVLDDERRTVWRSRVSQPPRDRLDLDLVGYGAQVPVRSASADFSDAEWGVERAIDGDLDATKGWGLNPSAGGRHTAVFELAHAPAGERLTIELVQRFGMHHTLGRFRLSVTDRVRPPRVLPADVTAALATPAPERDEAHRAALTRHYQTIDPELARMRDEIARLETELKQLGVVTTPVMVELPPDQRRTTRVLARGSFLSPGEVVEPGVPACLPPLPDDAPANRLGLARWLTSKQHPLTARVTVNRAWSRLFGAGLVQTEEDFGTQGTLPTHPALLDWLALELVEGGWDLKALHRTIVTSATYRQASEVRPVHLERDPQNRLYARGPRFRLEAEQVRDVLLSVSGLLSRETHGPSVFPPQPAGMWQAAFNGQRDWSESQGSDRWRRGLYVFLRRTIPYPSLATFDAPSREACTLRRSRTNTPLQAFVTLNDPVFVEAAQAFARRIVREGGDDVTARAAYAQRLALQRAPDPQRVAVLVDLYQDELAYYREHPDEALALSSEPLGPLPDRMEPSELAAWTVVANVVLNQDAVLVKN